MARGRSCSAPRDGRPGRTWPPSPPGGAAAGAPSAVRPEAISGDDVYIADYFRDEVLAAEPARTT